MQVRHTHREIDTYTHTHITTFKDTLIHSYTYVSAYLCVVFMGDEDNNFKVLEEFLLLRFLIFSST